MPTPYNNIWKGEGLFPGEKKGMIPIIALTDGLFPINLSRFQVEKDHTFLEQADLDSLVRRLNILNRCADVMESMHASRVSPVMM